MRRYFFLMLICAAGTVQAQPVSSSCEAPDSVVIKYRTDAKRLALSETLLTGSTYKDSTTIPAPLTNTFLRSMLAVYNATSIPERDTVVNIYNIHGRAYQAVDSNALEMNTIELQIDKSQQWVIDLQAGVIPTSNAQVNDLLTRYQAQKPYVTNLINYMFVTSDSDYNTKALAKKWLVVPGVYSGTPSGIGGDGNYLIGKEVGAADVVLVYSYGWGDCPAGCIYRRNWAFRVTDCDVEFLKSWEGAAVIPNVPSTYIPKFVAEKINISPNPCTEYFEPGISHPEKYAYRLYDMTGRLVQQESTMQSRINVNAIAPGIYMLQLMRGENTIQISKLIKQQ